MMNSIPDDPMRVAPPDDDFDDSQWLEICQGCERHLFEGDTVYVIPSKLPFGDETYCEDCLNSKFRRIL